MRHLAFGGMADRIRKLPMRGLPEEPTVRCARRLVVMLVFELLASVRDPTFEENGYGKIGVAVASGGWSIGTRSNPKRAACLVRYLIFASLFCSTT